METRQFCILQTLETLLPHQMSHVINKRMLLLEQTTKTTGSSWRMILMTYHTNQVYSHVNLFVS